MGETANRRFGRYLKNLRLGRELTLRQVADCSRKVSPDSAGRLSHAYLSQLESGARMAVSIHKLISLAAIYGIFPGVVLSRAPRRLRARLESDLAQRVAAGPALPRPLRTLWHLTLRIQNEMNAELRERAEDVAFPLGFEAECLSSSSEGISWATIVPFLEQQAALATLVRSFLSVYGEDVRDYLTNARWANRRSLEWCGVCEDFRKWLLFVRAAGPDLIRLVDKWSLDVRPGNESRYRLTCTFSDPAHQKRFGFRGVPLATIRALRWRQLAKLLFDNGIAAQVDHPAPPPGVAEAAVDALLNVIEPEVSGPASGLGAREAEIVEEVNALINGIPYLRRHPSASRLLDVRATVEVLSEAIAGAPEPDR